VKEMMKRKIKTIEKNMRERGAKRKGQHDDAENPLDEKCKRRAGIL